MTYAFETQKGFNLLKVLQNCMFSLKHLFMYNVGSKQEAVVLAT